MTDTCDVAETSDVVVSYAVGTLVVAVSVLALVTAHSRGTSPSELHDATTGSVIHATRSKACLCRRARPANVGLK